MNVTTSAADAGNFEPPGLGHGAQPGVFCSASDCARALSQFRNCAMCHLDFCYRCTSTGVFCHQCLQYTFLTREPPLQDPIRTAEVWLSSRRIPALYAPIDRALMCGPASSRDMQAIAPESIVHLVRQIAELRAELARSQDMVRNLQIELAGARRAGGAPADRSSGDAVSPMHRLASRVACAPCAFLLPRVRFRLVVASVKLALGRP